MRFANLSNCFNDRYKLLILVPVWNLWKWVIWGASSIAFFQSCHGWVARCRVRHRGVTHVSDFWALVAFMICSHSNLLPRFWISDRTWKSFLLSSVISIDFQHSNFKHRKAFSCFHSSFDSLNELISSGSRSWMAVSDMVPMIGRQHRTPDLTA